MSLAAVSQICGIHERLHKSKDALKDYLENVNEINELKTNTVLDILLTTPPFLLKYSSFFNFIHDQDGKQC